MYEQPNLFNNYVLSFYKNIVLLSRQFTELYLKFKLNFSLIVLRREVISHIEHTNRRNIF